MFRFLNLLMLSSTLAFVVTGLATSQGLISSATWSNLFHLITVTVVVVRNIKVLNLTANQLRLVNQFQ